MGALTARLRQLVMMMMGFGIDLPTFAAFYDHAVGIVMSHIDHKLGLASPAAIRFVTATFAHRRSSSVFKHIGLRRSIRRNKNHVELGHRGDLVRSGINLITQTAQGAQKRQSLILIGCLA